MESMIKENQIDSLLKECHTKCEAQNEAYSSYETKLMTDGNQMESLLKENQIKSETNNNKTDSATTKNQTNSAKTKDQTESAVEENVFIFAKYKLRVKNLPNNFGIFDFKKFINIKLNLNCSRVKPLQPNRQVLDIYFHSDEHKNTALGVLNGYNWMNTVLDVSIVNTVHNPWVQKRNKKFDKCLNEKSSNTTIEKRMINSIAPLLNVPYNEQLIQKTVCIRNLLLEYGRQFKQGNNSQILMDWLMKQQNENNGLPCALLEIQSLKDNLEEYAIYRNKCEFTIGMDIENKEPVVGFRVGTYAQGSTFVAPIDNVSNISQRMKDIVHCFQDLVRSSGIPVFDPKTDKGYWYKLSVRSGISQLMLICKIHMTNMKDSTLEILKKSILNYFTEGVGIKCNVDSLYFQKVKTQLAGQESQFPLELLYGQEYIIEEVKGLKFKIPPEAFFQTYTAASEILYNTAKDLASINSKTTVLDLCCGSGILGLSFAKDCAQVIGVEIQKEAVNMAKLNASENGIKNAQFFVGKAEEIMIRKEFQSPTNTDDMVAIIDPPRIGLHKKGILLLRKIKHLKHLVYMTCNPKEALKNFLTLSMAETNIVQGTPFVPVKAVPVDLFPETPYCELIVYFERYSNNN